MDWVVWFLSLGWELGFLCFLFLIFVFDLVQYTYVWYEPAVLYQECIFPSFTAHDMLIIPKRKGYSFLY
jgi:hypothetical protein